MQQIADTIGVGRATLYRHLDHRRARNAPSPPTPARPLRARATGRAHQPGQGTQRAGPIASCRGPLVELFTQFLAGLFERCAGEAAARVQEPQECADAFGDRVNRVLLDEDLPREVVE
jgi:hypothetical protein